MSDQQTKDLHDKALLLIHQSMDVYATNMANSDRKVAQAAADSVQDRFGAPRRTVSKVSHEGLPDASELDALVSGLRQVFSAGPPQLTFSMGHAAPEPADG